jgi:hypothetical protein
VPGVYPGNGQQQPSQNWGQQYQGFGLYDNQQPPEPPRKRTNLVMIFSIVAIVVIIGAVVTIVLLNRGDSTPQADNNTQAPNVPGPSGSLPGSKTAPTSASSKPGDQLKPKNPGWTVIKNDDAHLIYEVPATWKPDPSSSLSEPSLPGAKLSFVASASDYKCQNQGYSRGVLGGGVFPKSDVAQVGQKFAKAYGDDLYSSGKATTLVADPKKITDFAGPNGKVFPGAQVDAAITATGNECLATTGRVSVLVIDDGTDNYKVFMVNVDVAGGPSTPTPPLASEVQKILDSVRVY